MPSTYTPSLRLTLPQTGDLVGTWGNTVNNGITALLDQAVAGTVLITMTSNTTYVLSTANGATDQSRYMFLTIAGGPHTGTVDVVCPSVSKMYVVSNSTAGGQSIVFKTAGGGGPTIPNGVRAIVYCDGTNVGLLSTWGVSGAPTLVGNTSILGTASISNDAFIAGNLGVGTTSLISRLTVNGDIALSSTGQKLFYYYYSASNYAATSTTSGGDINWFTGVGTATERMRLTNDGRLGIGTVAPATNLHVNVGVLGGGILLDGSVAGGSVPLVIYNSNATAASSAQLTLWNDNGFSANAAFINYFSSASATPNELRITQGANAPLTFYTNNTLRLTIDNYGSVGIGSAPLALFSISGSVAGADVAALIRNTDPTLDSASTLFFLNDTGYSSPALISHFSSANNNEFRISSSDVISFYNYGTERLRLGSYFFFSTAELKADLVSIPTGTLSVPSAYATASGPSAKLVTVEPTGELTSTLSTRRVKLDINPLTDASFVMALNPVTYKRKKLINGVYVNEAASEQTEYGFIAEEVAAIDSRLATYEKVRDADGNVVIQPDGLAFLQFFAPTIRFVQQLKNEIDALRAELNALKGAN